MFSASFPRCRWINDPYRMQPLLPSKEVGLMGIGDIKFFESGLALIEGEGDLRGALTQLIQLAAEGANSNSASFYVIDAQEKVLKPLVTYGLPAAYVEACGNVRVGDQCCGRGELELRLVLRHRCPGESVEAASDLRIAGSLRRKTRRSSS